MLIFNRYSWWVGSMVGLAMLLAIMGQTGLLSPFQGLFLRITSPIESVLSGVFRPVASVLADAGEIGDLQDENDRLRLENEELRTTVVGLQEDTVRLRELEDLFNIGAIEGIDAPLPANIVHRDSSVFNDVVSIDQGEDDGVRKGMVVLSTKGTLIGTVTKVSGKQAFVRLITDTQSKVRAETVESPVDGIVAGSPGRGLSFDLAQGDIKVGDTLVTAGLGGNYPKGLPIGIVTEVSGTPQDLSKKVKVEPLVRLSTARTVLVLTSFIPQRLDLGAE